MDTEPQRRGAKVVDAVLLAAIGELARVGFEALSVEEVAARAGVNKTTVYRRWPTKGELVRAALMSASAAHRAVVDTGDLRRDLLLYASGIRDGLSTPEGRSIYVALLSNDPQVAGLASELHAEAEVMVREILARGIKRGELPRGVDMPLISGLIFGALQIRVLLLRDGTVTDDYLAKTIDIAISGANAVQKPRR